MSNLPVKVKGKFIVSAWDSLKIWILFNLPERNSLNGRLLNLQEFFLKFSIQRLANFILNSYLISIILQ